jgi:prepilin-type N-terminal cleavage/methylation domain-containing protein
MRRAFTLIELLIVIAIIAILALIAIPNFLESQVRAKVSRCMADMKAVGVAMQTYTVDYGMHPLSEGLTVDAIQNQLTTPIAYLTAWPEDPFAIEPVGQNRASYKYRALHLWDVSSDKDRTIWGRGIFWWIDSFGPSQTSNDPTNPGKIFNTYNMITGAQALRIYDPTNGMKSLGFIIMTNKGFYDGSQYPR